MRITASIRTSICASPRGATPAVAATSTRTAHRIEIQAGNMATDNPLDLFDIAGSLSADECMVQATVARFVDQRVLPIIRDHFEQHTFPRELVPVLAELGLLGSSISGYGCAGLNGVSYGLICQELERADSALRSFVSVKSALCMHPI